MDTHREALIAKKSLTAMQKLMSYNHIVHRNSCKPFPEESTDSLKKITVLCFYFYLFFENLVPNQTKAVLENVSVHMKTLKRFETRLFEYYLSCCISRTLL